MSHVMPSQVVETIDQLFPHAARGGGDGQLQAGHSPQLMGLLKLVKEVPAVLIIVPPAAYAQLVLALSTIQFHIDVWTARGNVGGMGPVNGVDAVTAIRRVLVQCPDEYPPPIMTELLFVGDPDLRESIRRDIGAATRAIDTAEWKASTVLAGAAIEALLLWKLLEPPRDATTVQATMIQKAQANGSRIPNKDINRWGLADYIDAAEHYGIIKGDTPAAAHLAQNFRNLIHPGKAARLGVTCDRATAYSALGALHHVIRDLA
jgi:hypothetical protein